MRKRSPHDHGGLDQAGDGPHRACSIALDDKQHVSAIFSSPPKPRACYVLAHGAGAGMTHPFLDGMACGLMARGLAALRYQFPYMELGSKRPDTPRVAHATVRAAINEAARLAPGVPLLAGGKSFGGRMTSQAQAQSPLPGVRGLVFLGFPLHPAGRPSVERADHLFQIQTPMLFLQGDRDELAELGLLQTLVKQLGSRATLTIFTDADHSFHVRKSSGQTDSQIQAQLLDAISHWLATL